VLHYYAMLAYIETVAFEEWIHSNAKVYPMRISINENHRSIKIIDFFTNEDVLLRLKHDESLDGTNSLISSVLKLTLLREENQEDKTYELKSTTYSFMASSKDNLDSVVDACFKKAIASDLLNVSFA